ncbi:glycoside hydrolase family 18 protein [Bipolaris victoriae FI3]|uniref:chitinase n=1 Tax=Bipolaris victoriae (strain FI3) TaxID=930091 RepID=W7EPR9_BIPV3|nr:glycoside hydrolase family 18 protein [Bipolaris victoriae FI3]
MRAFFHSFVLVARLSVGVLAIPSDDRVAIRAQDAGDDLDEWLAAAQRVSAEALKACPSSCSTASNKNLTSRAEWFLFPDATKLALCNETMLLDMVVKSAINDDAAQTVVRACSADYDSGLKAAFVAEEGKASLCTTANRVLEQNSIYLHQPQVGADEFSVNHLLSAGRQIANHIKLQEPSCTNNAMEFAYSQSSSIGLFAGAEVHQHGITKIVLEHLLQYAQDKAISKTTVVQLCGSDGRGADYSLGIVATSAKNLAFVQEVVRTWASGACVPATAGEEWMNVNLRVPGPVTGTSNSTNTTTAANNTIVARMESRSRLSIRADCRTTTVQSGDGCFAVAGRCGISQADLQKFNRQNLCNTLIKDEKVCCSTGTLPSTLPAGNSDGTCKTIDVVSGDSCGSLASKCGISSADFMKANTKTDLCSKLIEGQKVCCSNGKYPDIKPRKDANGNCAVYTTKKDDYCSKIAVSRDITVAELENFKMCISEGSPPMPANVPNAVCGPTMNGTTQPPAGTDLATLNPCLLNVCCNIWGQCGMTDDFCVISKSETGAPGTSAPGKNGCISNCGRDIIKGSAPASKIKLAYYESWNFNRPCLTMHVDKIDTSTYTHIHFAFANVTRGDYRVEITDPNVLEQFEIFKGMTGVKKIVSLGGWAFSTEPGTFQILREAAKPANREKFKNNLISFMNEHNLDGIDLDWEYPGAPDIPDIPSDDPVNGLNYYRLLSSLKSSVGSSKSVSFAAPASYWYLKSFPIKNMAKDLDYIVYMTYDLHGQWDYGNKWTSPGCDTGNCLRSHVNETETKDALSMITKAGAASNKVVVGVASYGRSFKMAQSGCDSEQCRFTGSPRLSNAAKGRCTETAGYISNAEINEIVRSGNVKKKWTSEGSNIMVYNDTEWVAWMDDDMKEERAKFYDSYNFAGTTDWAVDLQAFNDGSGDADDDDESYIDRNYWSGCTAKYTTLDQIDDAKDILPAHCLEQYMFAVEISNYEDALNKYKKLMDNGYDKKFAVYEKYSRDQVPEQINNFMATDKVDKYFNCKETRYADCCSDCTYPTCRLTCVDGDKNCKSGRMTLDIACPKMEFEDKGLDVGETIPNATFSFKDEEGFWNDLGETWGIEKSWVSFGRRRMRISNGCQYAGADVNGCIDDSPDWWYDYPRPSDNIEIYNPKKVIGDSYDTAKETLDRFKIMRIAGLYDEQMQMADLVDAASIPVYSAVEAIEAMEKIVEKANELKKKEREEMILNFIMGILFFIPVAGNAAGSVGLTAVRSMLRLVGTVGEAGLVVYDLVENPENAFLTIFSYVAGAGVGRSGFKNAANARRGMSSKEYQSLGNVKVKLNMLTSIRGSTCKI